MISCTRCLAVASTYEIEDEMDEEEWEVIIVFMTVMLIMLVMMVMMAMLVMLVKDNQIQKPHQVVDERKEVPTKCFQTFSNNRK